MATLAMVLTAASFVGTTPSADTVAAASSFFAGTWKGTMNKLPGIDLTIREAGGKRADVNRPWHATAEPALPLLNSHVNGRILTFEVESGVCDGCKELGSNRMFRMELFSANEARITGLEEDGTEGGPQVKLVRSSQASMQAAPPLQRGISVQMAVTRNAPPVPEADRPGALIVTVRDDGSVYLGVNPIELDVLVYELKSSLSGRLQNQLYIKADARAPYATVVKLLDTATAAGVVRTVMLTSQDDAEEPGSVVPPKGFTVVNGSGTVVRPKLPL